MNKLWVIGIICLFIGVGVYPAIAVESKSSADNTQKEEDCDCQEVDRLNLARVKFLLTRSEVITNILLSKFGHIPEVKEKCLELLDIIDLNRQSDYPIFCYVLAYIIFKLYSAIYWIYKTREELEEWKPIIGWFIALFLTIFEIPLVLTVLPLHLWGAAVCGWPSPFNIPYDIGV